MASPQTLIRLVDAQAAARDRINDRVSQVVADYLRAFNGWYSDAQVRQMSKDVVRVVEAGQKQTVSLTDAYLSRVVAAEIGRPTRPVGVKADLANLRYGVKHTEVYERLGAEYRYQVSEGKTFQEAAAITANRGNAMALMDMNLAMRDSAHQVYDQITAVDGYRRVIHPEFSRSGTCGLCAAASDQTYNRESLLPLHERCRCETLPIIGDSDPGRSLNDEELGSLYDEAGSTSGKDLKRVRVSVEQHGELGPVLRVEGQHFRSPSDVA